MLRSATRLAQLLSIPLLLTTAPAVSADGAAAALARGDRAWDERGEGQVDGRARPGPISAAVAAYESALEADPERLETYWKLLRAIYWQGDYTTTENDRETRRELFGRGTEVAEQAFDLLARRVGGREAFDAMAPGDFDRGRFPEPEVARIFFWAGANWGMWAKAYGKMAAARQGVAGKVRDYALVVIRLDPGLEEGGGYRVHSRIHTEAPKIPFITGWVDKKRALEDIEKAYRMNPRRPDNRFYYADALLRFDKDRRDEAITLLRELAHREPRPEKITEDTVWRRQAAALLAEASN